MKVAAVLGSALLYAGCGTRQTPPAAVPESSDPPADPRLAVPERPERIIRVCFMDDGRLREVQVTYNSLTGETTYEGRPFTEISRDTATYAAEKLWYINNEPVTWETRRFIKYGMPRPLAAAELRPIGRYDGVALFTEAAHPGAPEIVFVPTRPGCEFQSYQWDLTGLGVRGR